MYIVAISITIYILIGLVLTISGYQTILRVAKKDDTAPEMSLQSKVDLLSVFYVLCWLPLLLILICAFIVAKLWSLK